MKYRGNVYKSENNFLEVKETDIVGGKYRGCQWNHKLPRHVTQLRPKLGLQYRGVSYCSNPTMSNSVDSNINVAAISNETRKTIVCEKIHSVHLENMRRNLEKRIKVAQEENNETLLLMLKKESLELELV